MPEFLPGAVFSGIVTVVFVIIQRGCAGKPRPSAWKLGIIGIGAAYLVPWALALSAQLWRALPALPALPVITFDQVFIGAWAALATLAIGSRPGKRPFVPLWAGLLTGVAFAVLVPPFLDLVTGSYQRASLRADVNHCTRGMTGQSQPREITNICDETIAVGLCLSGELNPTPCAQTEVLQPGQTARFDPGGEELSSLPSNPNGITIVACRPPDRPSRMGTTIGRGYEGVCLPQG